MKVESIELTNYRNYKSLNLHFSDGVNIIKGLNAQGKTNLIEAIFLCSIGKSLRVSREKELIKFGEEFAKIKINIAKKYKNTQIFVYFSKKTKKSVKIDDIPIKKIGELLGEFNAVYFSPDELKLIKDSPEDRRRFFDIHISQISKHYFYLLNRYEKILANRNKLLKSNINIATLKDTLEIWNTQLIDIGSKIIYQRLKFINNLSEYAEKSHNYLSSNNEKLTLEYSGINLKSITEIENEFAQQLKNNTEKDIKLGYTTVGPHRDDLKIFINNIDVRLFGSQGQQRTVALSLKLAELEIMKNETGDMPVLLLDDVLSELDERRRDRLLKFCSKAQTFITCTEFPYNKDYHFYDVSGGSVNVISE